MTDSMQLMRELKKMNQKLEGMSTLMTSHLDLQSKMLTCESAINSPQLNSDFAVGNVDPREMNSILLDLELGRECFSIGAPDAGMGFFHTASEKITISRSKYGFMPKIIRTTIQQSSAKVTEDSGGFMKLGRGKEAT